MSLIKQHDIVGEKNHAFQFASLLLHAPAVVLYEFTQPQYTQSEDGGFLVATIQQVAGTLSGPITIVVVTSDRGGSNDAAGCALLINFCLTIINW